MRFNITKILFISTNLFILFILFSIGNSEPLGQFSLGILFTVLLWQRTDQQISRWVAVSVLWVGILFAAAWTWLV